MKWSTGELNYNEKRKNLYHPYFLLLTVISSLIGIFSPPLHIIGGLLHHWTKKISSTGSTSFPIWLCREWVGGQQAVDSFLPAARQHKKKNNNNYSIHEKREELGSLNSSRTKRDTAEICKYCLALGRQLKIWATAEELWIFKVIPCGSRIAASKWNYHVYLSADRGLVMIVLIWLFFSSRTLY